MNKLFFCLSIVIFLLAACHNIPEKYKDLSYCERSDDCAVQKVEGGVNCNDYAVNTYNHVKLKTVSGFCGHSTGTPSELNLAYCDNNTCKLKINCSNCELINKFVSEQDCFRNPFSVSACNDVISCDCQFKSPIDIIANALDKLNQNSITPYSIGEYTEENDIYILHLDNVKANVWDLKIYLTKDGKYFFAGLSEFPPQPNLTREEIADIVIKRTAEFLETNVSSFNLTSIDEKSGVYAVTLNFSGISYLIYSTKDTRLLLGGAINLSK